MCSKSVIAALLAFFALASSATADTPLMETEKAAAARWEASRHGFSSPPNCSPVHRGRTAPVASEARAETVSRLASAPAVAVSDNELNHFLSEDVAETLLANRDGVLSPRLVPAMAKNDVPVFFVYACDNLLVVDRLPARAAVLWSIAE